MQECPPGARTATASSSEDPWTSARTRHSCARTRSARTGRPYAWQAAPTPLHLFVAIMDRSWTCPILFMLGLPCYGREWLASV